MASLGMFGGSAPRIRRLQPMGNQFGPSIEDMRAQSIAEMQAGQAANEEMLQKLSNSGGRNSVPKPGGSFGLGPQGQPAPAPQAPSQAMSTNVATSSPNLGAFLQGPGGESPAIAQKIMQQELAYQARQPTPSPNANGQAMPAIFQDGQTMTGNQANAVGSIPLPFDAKKAIPMGDGPSGYSVGKRDWWGEVSKDPMFYLFNGQAGLDERRNEGIMSDYARQAAEESARREAAQEGSLRQWANSKNIDADAAVLAWRNNPEEFGKSVASAFGSGDMTAGNMWRSGIGGENVVAPIIGFEGSTPYSQTFEDGRLITTYGDNRPDSASEVTAQGTLAATIANNNMTNSLGRDRLAFDMDEAERKAVNGDPEFNAAQNARIYSDAMDAADAAMKNQGRLDTIARAALQFVENSKNYNSQGEGWWNDLGQALSMDTTGLKQLTDTIAPLIREPGSGGNSDADVNMFKSSVVSINNTKQANVNFANGAQALAGRNKEFVTYLSDAIDPNDPKSRQNANKIWLAYTEENPLYDPKTGELKSPPKFKDWLDIKTGRAVAPVTTSPMQMRTDRGSETIPAQSWSATTSGSARPVPTASTAPMGLRGGSGGGGGGQMGLGPRPSPAAPQSVQFQQPPPDIDPEDWKYFTPEMKQQYLAGRGQ